MTREWNQALKGTGLERVQLRGKRLAYGDPQTQANGWEGGRLQQNKVRVCQKFLWQLRG